MKVLIVDDNEMNLEVESKLLVDTEMVIDKALSGKIALDMTTTRHYDVILMDIRMPVMDGIEATKQIFATIAPLPIIALTANNSEEERAECRSAGMLSIASKPVTTQTLKVLLEELEDKIEEYGRRIREGNYQLMNAPVNEDKDDSGKNEESEVGTISSGNNRSNASLIDALIKNKLNSSKNNQSNSSEHQRT